MTDLPEQYRNRVVNGDVMALLRELPDSCIDMIYGDPDYNAGIVYENTTFTQTWDSYVEWYVSLAQECMRVLRTDGNLFFLNYPKQNAHLRVRYLDDAAASVNDYVWVYNTNVGHSSRKFTTAHRSILHATKSKHNRFYRDGIEHPYQNPTDPRIKERMRLGYKGRMPYSWLNFNLVKNVSRQKTKHPCQIPEGLSQLLIKATTLPGDTVFVLFGGSGSEVVQAKKLGRNFLTCDIQEHYCEIIESRLLQEGAIDPEYRNETQLKRLNGHGHNGTLPIQGRILHDGRSTPSTNYRA